MERRKIPTEGKIGAEVLPNPEDAEGVNWSGVETKGGFSCERGTPVG